MSSTCVLLYAASNFLTNTHCGCDSPLICNHGQRFAVKVGWKSRVTSQIVNPSATVKILESACIAPKQCCKICVYEHVSIQYNALLFEKCII